MLHVNDLEKLTKVAADDEKFNFKGTVTRDFRLLVFFMDQFPPSPLGPFQNFSKIRGDNRSSRCTTGVVDTGGKWKKSSIIKVLIILFGHLHFCLQVHFKVSAA